MAQVDHVVVLCRWARDVLARNGVPDEKVTLSRQGIPDRGAAARGGPLREELGRSSWRISAESILPRAPTCWSKRLPQFPMRRSPWTCSQFFRPAQTRRGRSWKPGWRATALDAAPDRCTRYGFRDHERLRSDRDPVAFAGTGPLVVLEAFAAGVPVLGSDLGGIAESVRNGVDGILLRPDDVHAWAATISRLAENRDIVSNLKRDIRPPRTMDDVARDMSELYFDLDRQNLGRSVEL